MTDKEVRDLEERKSGHEYNQTVQKRKRLAAVVDVLPKPKRRPFG